MDNSTRSLYAAHIVKQGLNKEGWKLVITGATPTVCGVYMVAASGLGCQMLLWCMSCYQMHA